MMTNYNRINKNNYIFVEGRAFPKNFFIPVLISDELKPE